MTDIIYNKAPEIEVGQFIEIPANNTDTCVYIPASSDKQEEYSYLKEKYSNISKIVVFGLDSDNKRIRKFYINKDTKNSTAISVYNTILKAFNYLDNKKSSKLDEDKSK